MSYDPSFTPFNIVVEAKFDDADIGVQTYPNHTLVFFGTPRINSPLTPTLPYGPLGTIINPPDNRRFSLLSGFDYGPPNQGSYFQFRQYQHDGDGLDRAFAYTLTVKTPNYPPLLGLDSFTGPQLRSYLRTLMIDGAEVYFDEGAQHYDTVSGVSLDGIGYTGLGTITAVSEVPEPASALLVTVGGLGILVGRRALRRTTVPTS